MWLRWFCTAIFLLSLSEAAKAQMPPPNQRQQQQRQGQQFGQGQQQFGGQQQMPMQMQQQEVTIVGALQNIVRGGIVVLENTGKTWQVAIPAAVKVRITGTATVDYLQNGMVVDFKGEIDAQGNLTGAVDALTIVSANVELGLFPPDTKPEDAPPMHGGHPGAKQGKHGKDVEPGTYRIVGKLSIGRKGDYSVETDRGTLSLELADPATIDIDTNDISLIAQGDKVTVHGITMPNAGRQQPNMPGRADQNNAMTGRCQAKQVTIELMEKLDNATPAKKKKASSKAGTKKAK